MLATGDISADSGNGTDPSPQSRHLIPTASRSISIHNGERGAIHNCCIDIRNIEYIKAGRMASPMIQMLHQA